MAKDERPDWPRMMRRSTVAAYLDVSEAAVEREIMHGRLPISILFGGRRMWDRVQIDRSVATITGDAASDWRARSGLYGVKPALDEA